MAYSRGIIGDTADVVSRETSYSAQQVDRLGPDGQKLESYTTGAEESITEEVYIDGAFTNEAIDGQISTSSDSGIVVEHSIIESNADYVKVRKRTVRPLGTTTTTVA